ncbi:hypothetical protein JCM24511_00651 [Saitozyma sp. JCM 24511]|nr:hypothetical protein JCM24511_00651 [Saitozyma sp. JCM 24511]
MSSNPSSSPSIGSDDNQLEKVTSVGSTSSHGSSSSRSRARNLFGSLNKLRKSSGNLRGDAVASDLAAGTDTPRAASPVDSAPESTSALTADMRAKVHAARLARDRAASASGSEASQTQSTTSQSQSATQSATQSSTQSSTKPPARYGSTGYTEEHVARKDAANSYPGIHAAGAQKAIDAFNKQGSQYRSQQE